MRRNKLIGVSLDEKTRERLQAFQKEIGLTRSGAVRVLIWQATGGRCDDERKPE